MTDQQGWGPPQQPPWEQSQQPYGGPQHSPGQPQQPGSGPFHETYPRVVGYGSTSNREYMGTLGKS